MNIIVLIGAPGSGKGTQANFLKSKGYEHISTGEILREEVKKKSLLGEKVKKIMDEGKLVSDEIINEIMFSFLRNKKDGNNILLDGYPRNISQAKALSDFLTDNDSLNVIYIEVPEEVCRKRLSGRYYCPECNLNYNIYFSPPKEDKKCDNCGKELKQRDDDREETVEKRLKVYFSETYPLINYYKDKGILHVIDGNRSVEEIKKDILKIVEDGSD